MNNIKRVDDLGLIYYGKECEKFYYKVLAEWSRGEGPPPDSDFLYAPIGYIEFLEDHPELRVKIKRKEKLQIECQYCKRLYSVREAHCPYPDCGKSNTK